MKKELTFKKEGQSWYIDLPNWIGPKSALSMVAGADKLLDLYNMYSIKKNNIVDLKVSDDSSFFKPIGILRLRKISSSLLGGATYETGIEEVPTIWLCPVTLFVLHDYPELIHVEPEFWEDEKYNRVKFMEPSLYYFTYKGYPGTGPKRNEELGLKENYDFNDWNQDLYSDRSFTIKMYNEGKSIQEIAKELEISEEEVKGYLNELSDMESK